MRAKTANPSKTSKKTVLRAGFRLPQGQISPEIQRMLEPNNNGDKNNTTRLDDAIFMPRAALVDNNGSLVSSSASLPTLRDYQ